MRFYVSKDNGLQNDLQVMPKTWRKATDNKKSIYLSIYLSMYPSLSLYIYIYIYIYIYMHIFNKEQKKVMKQRYKEKNAKPKTQSIQRGTKSNGISCKKKKLL